MVGPNDTRNNSFGTFARKKHWFQSTTTHPSHNKFQVGRNVFQTLFCSSSS